MKKILSCMLMVATLVLLLSGLIYAGDDLAPSPGAVEGYYLTESMHLDPTNPSPYGLKKVYDYEFNASGQMINYHWTMYYPHLDIVGEYVAGQEYSESTEYDLAGEVTRIETNSSGGYGDYKTITTIEYNTSGTIRYEEQGVVVDGVYEPDIYSKQIISYVDKNRMRVYDEQGVFENGVPVLTDYSELEVIVEYDADGHIISVVNIDVETNLVFWEEKYTYKDDENYTVILRQGENGEFYAIHEYENGNIVREEECVDGVVCPVWVYTYDDSGNLLTKWYGFESTGHSIFEAKYCYDDHNRLVEYRQSGSDIASNTIFFEYDEAGNCIRETTTDEHGTVLMIMEYKYEKFVFENEREPEPEPEPVPEPEPEPEPEPDGNPFTDVEEGRFYYDSVMWAVENSITAGTSSTKFSPEAECTRGQVVTFLWRAAGEPEPTTSSHPFTDVSSKAYYYKAMLWAVENGITAGTSATTFAPNDECTRGQVVTFLWRAANKPAPQNTTHQFTDVSPTAFYYKAMLWAVENGVTAGFTKTTFYPSGPCTRGQVVTFLYRWFD